MTPQGLSFPGLARSLLETVNKHLSNATPPPPVQNPPPISSCAAPLPTGPKDGPCYAQRRRRLFRLPILSLLLLPHLFLPVETMVKVPAPISSHSPCLLTDPGASLAVPCVCPSLEIYAYDFLNGS